MKNVTKDTLIGIFFAFELREFGEVPLKSESTFEATVSEKQKLLEFDDLVMLW